MKKPAFITSIASLALFLLFLFSAFLANASPVSSAETPSSDVSIEPICIVYFYSAGCPHCAKVSPVISGLEEKYGSKIEVHKLDVSSSIENYNIYNRYCGIKDIPPEQKGVPFVAIGSDYYIGDTTIINNLEGKIKELLETGERVCPIEGELVCHPDNSTSNKNETDPALPWLKNLSLPLVIGAGLADGIFNPCALGVMAFLVVTFISVLETNRKRIIKIGAVYIATVYITYFLAGLGILAVLQAPAIASIKTVLFKFFAVALFLAALINIKDFFFYGKGFSLKIPESKKETIKRLAYRSSIPAAIALGFFVSLWELPCTGETYFGILALISSLATKTQATFYLLIYNFMFILPLIALLVVMVKGVKTERVQHTIEKNKKIMRLVLGAILLLMAALLWSIA